MVAGLGLRFRVEGVGLMLKGLRGKHSAEGCALEVGCQPVQARLTRHRAAFVLVGASLMEVEAVGFRV